MRESSLFPFLLSTIYNYTPEFGHVQWPFKPSNTAIPASSSSGAAAVPPVSSDPFPIVPHASLSSISTDQWAALNSSVAGRLHADGTPYARACFDQYEGEEEISGKNTEACSSLQAGYLSEKYRLPHFGSAMSTQWETCQATADGCLLDWMNTKNPDAFQAPRVCHQGSVSKYYIDIREASDVTAAFDFARRTGTRLVVKNTGHDYMGRSTAPDSLSLWTRNLQGITYNPSFRPESCERSSEPAITIGAGTVFGQVYDFAEKNDLTFVGGTDRTVGASGGWVQGGGHSLLSPTLGLGADRALQFKVVVPSGEYLTANACENPDLFFALRGGGGGTFGVVMETTFKVEPRPTSIRAAKITFPAVPSNWKGVVRIAVENGLRWSEEAWSGVIGTGLVVLTNTRLSLDEARESFQPYADFAASVNGTVTIEDSPTWLQFFDKFIGGNPVGLPGTPASRLVPRSNLRDASSRAALQDAIIEGTTSSQFKQLLMSCPTQYSGDTENTSVTEAWRDCVWSVAVGTFWNYKTSVDGIRAAYDASTEAIRRVKELTPGSGAYGAEADIHEEDWERAFWGKNYPRLLSIKHKYDPHGLLDCWHCVGWKGASDGRYSCMI